MLHHIKSATGALAGEGPKPPPPGPLPFVEPPPAALRPARRTCHIVQSLGPQAPSGASGAPQPTN